MYVAISRRFHVWTNYVVVVGAGCWEQRHRVQVSDGSRKQYPPGEIAVAVSAEVIAGEEEVEA
jgi:hypothetical protein